jgi:hypothetical protein
MSRSLIQPLTLKDLEKAILKKAQNRNEELNIEFYSYDIKEYEFIDVNAFTDYKLLLFRCPKSKSTVSLKINNKINQFGGNHE